MVHTPLLAIQFPGNAFIIYDELIKLVTFEVLPTHDIFPNYFDFPDRGYLNDRFERLDYGYYYSIMLLGFLFIVMMWMMLLYPVILLLVLCRLRFYWPKRAIKKLGRLLFWKQWIVFSYTTFQELFIIVFLHGYIAKD